jgi:hypothetical protein
MQSIIQQSVPTFIPRVERPSVFKKFFRWCTIQEKNRFGWVASSLAIHGCVLTPFTLFAIILSGNNIVYWVLATIAMMMTLVVNLAAMPTKVTIPTFFLSILLDLFIISSCVAAYSNIAGL